MGARPRLCLAAAAYCRGAWRWPYVPGGGRASCRCRAVPGRPVLAAARPPLAGGPPGPRWVILVTPPANPPIRSYRHRTS